MSFFDYCCHCLNNRLTYLNIYKLFSFTFSSQKHLGQSRKRFNEEGDSLNRGLAGFSMRFGNSAGLKGLFARMRSAKPEDFQTFNGKIYKSLEKQTSMETVTISKKEYTPLALSPAFVKKIKMLMGKIKADKIKELTYLDKDGKEDLLRGLQDILEGRVTEV